MESKDHHDMIPIWFFIGLLLSLYGAIILVTGLAGWNDPPMASMSKEIRALHVEVWWGAMMLVLGLIYTIKFKPGADKAK